MSYKFMRVLVFYDLPNTTKRERKIYINFRKQLLGMGFIMLQESIYCKLVPNTTAAKSVEAHIRKLAPAEGLVQMMTITERQFENIEYVTGTASSIVIDSLERVVVL